MKKIGCFLLAILPLLGETGAVRAQEAEESPEAVEREYREAGNRDAKALQKRFDEMRKPKFQKAYDDYLEDLKVIKLTGTAPDNEKLYDDLRRMNSNEKILYSVNKPELHKALNILR